MLGSTRQNLTLVLDSTAEGIFGLDASGFCTLSNAACVRMLGYPSPRDLVGRDIHRLIHHTQRDGRPYPERACPILGTLRQGHESHVVDEVFWRFDGTSLPVEYWSRPVYRDGRLDGAVVTFLDIIGRDRAEHAARLLESLSKAISDAEDLRSGLVLVMDAVCAATGWAYAQSWVPRSEGDALERCASSRTADERFARFRESTEGCTFTRGAGLPGRVWSSGRHVWVRDVSTDAAFQRRGPARSAGFKAAMAVPVCTGGEAVAVLEFFRLVPAAEDEKFVALIESIARQLGMLSERRLAVEARQRTEDELQDVLSSISDYVWSGEIDDKGRFVYRYYSPVAEQLTGWPPAFFTSSPQRWLSIVHPEDRPRLERALLRAWSAHSRHENEEYRIVRPDGQVRWVRDSIKIRRCDDGRRRLDGVVSDITERKQGELERADLLERLVTTQETERRRIAIELHDEVGQLLTGLKLMLEAPEERGAGGPQAPGAPSPAPRQKMGALVDELLDRVRSLSMNLRPPMLDHLGLTATLAWMFVRHKDQTGVHVHFDPAPMDRRLPQEIEIALLRIIQEALTNVARHSGASEAWVRLWSDGACARVQIEDHGRGFDPEAARSAPSTGLTGMRERARLLGGQLEVIAGIGSGVSVMIEVPVPPGPPTRGELS